jgi:general transcriptional corepressor TUP1
MITIETPTITAGSTAVNQSQDAGVTSVSISPDGSMVAAGSLDSVIRIWEVASGILLDSLRGHRDSVYSVAFTPDGRGIISGSLDKSMRLWDLSSLLQAKNQDSSLKVGGGGGSSGGSRPSSSSISTPVRDFIGHKVRLFFPFSSSRKILRFVRIDLFLPCLGFRAFSLGFDR